MTEPERQDGVVNEDGVWCAYVDGRLVACGPDRHIIEAAYKFHASEDEHRWSPDDEARRSSDERE